MSLKPTRNWSQRTKPTSKEQESKSKSPRAEKVRKSCNKCSKKHIKKKSIKNI